jgi:hypothetical protein
MRQPRILDVVRAVKTVAHDHPEVAAWWYAPPQRLRLAGALPETGAPHALVELALEADGGRDAPFTAIARALSDSLDGVKVSARLYRGDLEQRPLFRLVSRDERLGESG